MYAQLGGVIMIIMGTIAFIQAGRYPFGGLSTVRPAAVLVLSVGAAVCLLAAYGCARALLGHHSVSIPVSDTLNDFQVIFMFLPSSHLHY